MWELFKPLIPAILITASAYYLFEILIPYADEVKRIEQECIDKGGFIYESRRSTPICVNKDAIIL